MSSGVTTFLEDDPWIQSLRCDLMQVAGHMEACDLRTVPKMDTLHVSTSPRRNGN